MKHPVKTMLLWSVCTSFAFGSDTPPRIQDYALDDHQVFAIPVAANRVTTISFPEPISAIDGALVTTYGKTPGLFQIGHTKGTAYLSARALAKEAVTNLNVRCQEHTYVLELRESATPLLSVLFKETKPPTPLRPVTPARLLGMLDKAKAYELLQQAHPEALAGVDSRTGHAPAEITDCGDYEIRVEQAYRFNLDDTLVFKLALRNKTARLIEFTPEQTQLRVGEHVLYPSVAQLGELLPAHSTVEGYVAFTGTAEGERNDLSLKNEFTFVLQRASEGGELPKQEEGFSK